MEGEGQGVPRAISGLLSWEQAVRLQAHRVLDGDPDPVEQQIDALFFAYALQGLVAEAEMASKELPPADEIRAAIDRFRSAVPDAKTIRDAIAHMDEWSRGKGRTQRDRPWNTFFGSRPGEFELWITDMRLNVREAWQAAELLHWAVFTAWSDQEAGQITGPDLPDDHD